MKKNNAKDNKEKNLKTTTYHHGNLKEELLNYSIEIINSKGVEALTLSVLAKKLGTSRSAIYRHFSSKDELMYNVMLYGFNLFEKKVSYIFFEKEKDVLERLYIMGKEYINFAIKHPNLYRMLFGEMFQNIREKSCNIEDKEQTSGFHALVDLLIEAQEKSLLRIDNPLSQAQVVHAMVHGVSSLYIDGHIHIKDNINPLYETCYQTLINGLKR